MGISFSEFLKIALYLTPHVHGLLHLDLKLKTIYSCIKTGFLVVLVLSGRESHMGQMFLRMLLVLYLLRNYCYRVTPYMALRGHIWNTVYSARPHVTVRGQQVVGNSEENNINEGQVG